MYKLVPHLFSVISLIYGTSVFANADRGDRQGHDMFRPIEKFERGISYERQMNSNPVRYTGCHDTGCTFCVPYENPCKAAARMYEYPVRHGEPVVSEDDY